MVVPFLKFYFLQKNIESKQSDAKSYSIINSVIGPFKGASSLEKKCALVGISELSKQMRSNWVSFNCSSFIRYRLFNV